MQLATSQLRLAPVTADESQPRVSVVIVCHEQARFLSEAIESALAQTDPAFDVVVVDDGSEDETAAVAARYPDVVYVRQARRGLAAARNTGLGQAAGEYVVFLDADDRLLPEALAAGIADLRANPYAAFTSGHHRRIDACGGFLEEREQRVVHRDHHLALLAGNYVAMHATVMYRRSALEAVRGFDESLACCEDYDLYLRLARRFQVCCHQTNVAEYRQHGANMSADASAMLAATLRVLDADLARSADDERSRCAARAGRRAWRAYYGRELARTMIAEGRAGRILAALRTASTLVASSPGWMLRATGRALRRPIARAFAAVRREPRPATVRWGDLRRLEPLSRRFGFDRGLPIDRWYIERFLGFHRADVRGRVLEVGDRGYTVRFGGDRVQRSDVLNVSAATPETTIVANLARAEAIPSNAFDCIVLTQTLQLIYDLRAAVATLHRILKPGGVLLATVPGVTSIERGRFAPSWCWSLTPESASRLFCERFATVEVEAHGNVLAATAFLQGLAAEELGAYELAHRDPLYPLIVTVRAVKGAQP